MVHENILKSPIVAYSMVGFNEMENAVVAAKTRRKYFSAFTNQYSSKKNRTAHSRYQYSI